MKVLRDWKRIMISYLAIIAVFVFFAMGVFIATKNHKTAIGMNKQEMLRMQNYDQITEDDEYADSNKRVSFSAFFTRDLNGDGYAEKILGTCNKLDATDTMYINIGVNTEGHLENGEIRITPQNIKNYTYQMSMLEDDVLASRCVGDDISRITLNEVDAGMSKVLSGVIRSRITTDDSFCGVVLVTLTGTYVDDHGTSTPINKTFELNIDWYGTATTTLSASNSREEWGNIGENNPIAISCNYTVNTKGLPVNEQYITLSVPEIFGYYPDSIYYDEADDVYYDYDETNHVLNIKYSRSSKEISGYVNLIYPKEIYASINSQIDEYNYYTVYTPISAYAKCANNPNEEFQNPFITRTVSSNCVLKFFVNEDVTPTHHTSMEFMDRKYLGQNSNNKAEYGWSKNEFLNLYDSADTQSFKFRVKATTVRAKIDTGTEQTYGPAEITHTYVNNTFGNYSANDFTFVESIAFTNTSAMKYDGYIRIIDIDTDEVIKEFRNGEWLLYGQDNPYVLENPVSRIGIETSGDDNRKYGTFETIATKYIDFNKMRDDITREQLEGILNFETYVTTEVGNVVNMSEKALLFDDVSYTEVATTPKS